MKKNFVEEMHDLEKRHDAFLESQLESDRKIKERPILFSSPMVKAILDGTKTQTRRIVKITPQLASPGYYATGNVLCDLETQPGAFMEFRHESQDLVGYTGSPAAFLIACPHGKIGDRLWVRETWMPDPSCEDDAWDDAAISYVQWAGCRMPMHDYPDALKKNSNVIYRASWGGHEMVGWKPSIFMPRWASRINLEITNVRVERLNDISEEDAKAEGVHDGMPPPIGKRENFPWSHKLGFSWLWESINGPGSWQANPWVFAIDFKKV